MKPIRGNEIKKGVNKMKRLGMKTKTAQKVHRKWGCGVSGRKASLIKRKIHFSGPSLNVVAPINEIRSRGHANQKFR